MSLTTIRAGEDWVGNPPPTTARHPSIKGWNEDAQSWIRHVPKAWDGYGWSRPPGDNSFAYRTPFAPDYLGADSVFTRDVSTMPLATKSADYAAWMAANITYGGGFGTTGINLTSSGTIPIPCYVIDSTTPGTTYQHMTCGGIGVAGTSAYGAAILTGFIPWPRWVKAATNQDRGLAIYDLGTGIFREYFLVQPVAGYTDRWTAVVGGYTIYPRGALNLGAFNPGLQLTAGSNAVARMHNHLGFIDIAGARNGRIDHAIAFTCANMATPDSTGEAILGDGTRYPWTGVSWPAQAGDGDTAGDVAPIHGQWARIPTGIDLTPYTPFVRMVIEAVQTYGMVATDTNNFVHAFNTEPSYTEMHWHGVDPWNTQGDIFQKFAQANLRENRSASNPFDMGGFPWHLTEWAPRNWGKPE